MKGARHYIESHPAGKVLADMLDWLKGRGYETRIRASEGVVIISPHNTYVAKEFYPASSDAPKCVGLMELIMCTRNRALMGD